MRSSARDVFSDDVEVKNSKILPSVFIPPSSTVLNDIKLVKFNGNGGDGSTSDRSYAAHERAPLSLRVSDEEAFYLIGGRIVHTGGV